jgi:hypothetical protein
MRRAHPSRVDRKSKAGESPRPRRTARRAPTGPAAASDAPARCAARSPQAGSSGCRQAGDPGAAGDIAQGAPTGVCDESSPVGAAIAVQNQPDALTGNPSRCAAWRGLIQEKLEAGFSVQRIYQDLREDHGYAGSYHSVRRLARKLCAVRELPFRRMECEPGAEAQVDFGRGAPIVADGRRSGSWVFRIVLSHSRKGYSE